MDSLRSDGQRKYLFKSISGFGLKRGKFSNYFSLLQAIGHLEVFFFKKYRFKNTYKMEFFTDSYYSDYTSMSMTDNNNSKVSKKPENLTEQANSQIF